MLTESILWAGIALLLPAVLRLTRRRWGDLLERAGLVHILPWAPYLYGILPPYLALVTGAVNRRDMDLLGFTRLEWVYSGAACAMLVAAVYLLTSEREPPERLPDPLLGATDEFRWMLYRAVGVIGTGQEWEGWLVGGFWMLGEWLVRWGDFRWELPAKPEARIEGVRMTGSTALAVVTGNLWLIAGTHMAVLALLHWRSRQKDMPSSQV